jgi:hypothetical protein
LSGYQALASPTKQQDHFPFRVARLCSRVRRRTFGEENTWLQINNKDGPATEAAADNPEEGDGADAPAEGTGPADARAAGPGAESPAAGP